jgi:hypothetical protein
VSSTLGGDDPKHDLTPEEKDRAEAALRKNARQALREGRPRERKILDARAVEISRLKSKKAHQS